MAMSLIRAIVTAVLAAVLVVPTLANAQVLQTEQSIQDWNLYDIAGIAFSSDSRHLYYLTSDGIVHLERDLSTGEKTFVRLYAPGYDELENVTFGSDALITLSPDGRHLYVSEDYAEDSPPGAQVSPHQVTDGVIFDRDTTTGALTFSARLSTTDDGERFYNYDLIFLNDGSRGLLVSTFYRSSPYYFERDVASGAITITGPALSTTTKDSGSYWTGLFPSPDGRDIYRSRNDGIEHYRTETDSNDYAYVATYHSPADGIEQGGHAIYGALDMVISPDGRFAYVVSQFGGTYIAILTRNTDTGALSFSEVTYRWAEGLWLSPDGQRLLSSDYYDLKLHSVDTDTGDIGQQSTYHIYDGGPSSSYAGADVIATPDLGVIHLINMYASRYRVGVQPTSEFRSNAERTSLSLVDFSPFHPDSDYFSPVTGALSPDTSSFLAVNSKAGLPREERNVHAKIQRLDRDLSTSLLIKAEVIDLPQTEFTEWSDDGRFFVTNTLEIEPSNGCYEIDWGSDDEPCLIWVDEWYETRLYEVSADGTEVVERGMFEVSRVSRYEENYHELVWKPIDVLFSGDGLHIYVFFRTPGNNNDPVDIFVETYSWDDGTKTLTQTSPRQYLDTISQEERFKLHPLGDDIHFAMHSGRIVMRDPASGVLNATGDHMFEAPFDAGIIDIVVDEDGQGGYIIGGVRNIGRFFKTPGAYSYYFGEGLSLLAPPMPSAPYESWIAASSPDGSLLVYSDRITLRVYAASESGEVTLVQVEDLASAPWSRSYGLRSIEFTDSGSHVYLVGSGITVASVHDPIGLSGKLLADEGGEVPLLGTVIITNETTQERQVFMSDGAGEYRISETDPGTYTLSAGAPGYLPMETTIAISGDEVPYVEHRLTPDSTVPYAQGSFTDSTMQLPFVGYLIHHEILPIPPYEQLSRYLAANALGDYVIPGGYTEDQPLQTTFSLSPSQGVVLNINDEAPFSSFPVILDQEFDRSASEGARLTGRVYSAGVVMRDALVVVEGPSRFSTFSDSDGHFLFADLPPGTYTVHASAPYHRRGSRRVDFNENGMTSHVLLEMTPTAPPELSASPETLTFEYTGGTQYISVENLGGGSIQWDGYFEPEVNWVSRGFTKRFEQDMVAITADPITGDSYEPRTTTYNITSPLDPGPVETVTIFQEAQPYPSLIVSTDSLAFDHERIRETIHVTNGGGGTIQIDGEFDPPVDWISASIDRRRESHEVSFGGSKNRTGSGRTARYVITNRLVPEDQKVVTIYQAGTPFPHLTVSTNHIHVDFRGGDEQFFIPGTALWSESFEGRIDDPPFWILSHDSGVLDHSTIRIYVKENVSRWKSSRIAKYIVESPAYGGEREEIIIEQAPMPKPDIQVGQQVVVLGHPGGDALVEIQNASGGPLVWDGRFEPEVAWVSANYTGRQRYHSVTFSVAPNGLDSFAARTTSFIVDSPYVEDDEQVIVIEQAAAPLPELSVTPAEMDFFFEGGVETATVENVSGGPLSWEGRFEPEVDWVTVEVSKDFTQSSFAIRAAANIYGMYKARTTSFIVENGHATNGPQTISIFQEAPPMLTDIDGNDGVDAVDIQLIINRLLSLPGAPGNGDVNNDGKQDATDLQLVINAVLGV